MPLFTKRISWVLEKFKEIWRIVDFHKTLVHSKNFFSRCERFRVSPGFTRFWLPQVCFTGMDQLTTLFVQRINLRGTREKWAPNLLVRISHKYCWEKITARKREKNSDIFNSKVILDWIFNLKFLQHKLKLLMAIPWRRSCQFFSKSSNSATSSLQSPKIWKIHSNSSGTQKKPPHTTKKP